MLHPTQSAIVQLFAQRVGRIWTFGSGRFPLPGTRTGPEQKSPAIDLRRPEHGGIGQENSARIPSFDLSTARGILPRPGSRLAGRTEMNRLFRGIPARGTNFLGRSIILCGLELDEKQLLPPQFAGLAGIEEHRSS